MGLAPVLLTTPAQGSPPTQARVVSRLGASPATSRASPSARQLSRRATTRRRVLASGGDGERVKAGRFTTTPRGTVHATWREMFRPRIAAALAAVDDAHAAGTLVGDLEKARSAARTRAAGSRKSGTMRSRGSSARRGVGAIRDGHYYNENDPFAAKWLENLSEAGHIARGRVDARSIKEITPSDLAGVVQFHAFGGIGVWSYALRLAGWPDDAPVWTGSCPCQPFSQAAGAKRGFADERHLWPVWFELIRQCRPAIVLGEQVASPDGLAWLDLVSADLEGAGYAFGASDLCAAGVGAPHLRQRLYFTGVRRDAGAREDAARALEHADRLRHEAWGWGAQHRSPSRSLGDPSQGGRAILASSRVHDQGEPGDDPLRRGASDAPDRPGPCNGFWAGCEWVWCRPGPGRSRGCWRPTEPSALALADGTAESLGRLRAASDQVTAPPSGPLCSTFPGRVGRLKGYGNAIVASQAATFIRAVMQSIAEVP